MTIEDLGAVGMIRRSGSEAVLAQSDGVIIKKKKGSRKKVRIQLKQTKPLYSVNLNLQKLFEACLHVFNGPGTVPSPQNVNNLCRILDKMNPEDVGLSINMFFFKPKSESDGPPRVTTSTIYKCDDFEMCIFFLPSNALIPLHNHPKMTVFTKLLIGKMHIKAYDWADNDQVSNSSKRRLAKLKANKIFSTPSEASVLYPTSGGNIHEFRGISPCAFLDIIGPPYSKDEDRDCSFYKETEDEIPSDMEKNGCYRYLEEIEPPKESEMDGIQYMGPQIST